MTGALNIPSSTLKCSPAPDVRVRLSVNVMYLMITHHSCHHSCHASPVVISDRLPEEHIEGNCLPHVARAGELPLEAGVAGQLVHVTVHHAGSEVVFT